MGEMDNIMEHTSVMELDGTVEKAGDKNANEDRDHVEENQEHLRAKPCT